MHDLRKQCALNVLQLSNPIPPPLTDHNEGVLCSRPDPDMRLLQVLLSQQGLLEAREQVVVLHRVSQSICCLLLDLGQAFLPQTDHPGGKERGSTQY